MALMDKRKLRRTGQILGAAIAVVILLVIAGVIFIKAVPGWGIYVVKSGSMEPAINPGDIVITGPVGGTLTGDIAPGKVITFTMGKETVTHRVVSVDNGSVKTKGDANEDPDASAVSNSQIKGVYLFKVPYLGYIQSFVATKKGWFILVIIPTAVLVLWIVRDILKEVFKKDNNISTKKQGGD
jgi:signal peptidase I